MLPAGAKGLRYRRGNADGCPGPQGRMRPARRVRPPCLPGWQTPDPVRERARKALRRYHLGRKCIDTISYVITLLFVLLIIVQYFRNRPTLWLMLAYSLLSPYIVIAGAKYDGMYVGVLALWLAVLVKNKGKLQKIKNVFFNHYFRMAVFVYGVYLVSWLVFNRTHTENLLIVYTGAMKAGLFMAACYVINRKLPKAAIQGQVYWMIVFVVLCNAVFVFLQRTNTSLGLELIHTLQNGASYSYALQTTQWGVFSRCFGAMPYPMQLAIFTVFAHAFIISMKKKVLLKNTVMIVNLALGVFSASKTFFIGIIIVTAQQFLTLPYFAKTSKKTVWIGVVLLTLFGLAVWNYDWIYTFLDQNLGSNYARYWGFLSNREEIFSTRYSNDASYLSYMPEFLKQYWLMGVGPVSLNDERIIDSAFYVILHNGGIIALIPVVAFYLRYLAEGWRRRDQFTFLIMTSILMTGVGFQTWVLADPCVWPLAYLALSANADVRVRAGAAAGCRQRVAQTQL